MINCILFDYGRVLGYPVTGNWFITPKTPEILGDQIFFSIMSRPDDMSRAFQKALEYLNKNHLLHTESEEIEQFTYFYKLFLDSMGISCTEDVYLNLANDIVCNDGKAIFYDDVLNGLRELKQNYSIAVLSDTWPSLRRVLDNVGILSYLDALIMSCDYNETKESTKLFEIAISKLQMNPHNILFVDDSQTNLSNAEKVGLIPVLMDRDGKINDSCYKIARNINDVHTIIQNYKM